MNNDVVKINTEPKVKSKSTDVKTANKPSKDKPSLFDKMVSKNISQKEDIKSTNASKDLKTQTDKKASLFDNLKTTSTNKANSKNIDTKVSMFDNLKTTSTTKDNSKNTQKTEEDKQSKIATTSKDLKTQTNTKVSMFDNLKTTSATKANSKNTQKTEEDKQSKIATTSKDLKTQTNTKVSMFDNLKSTSATKADNKKIQKDSQEIDLQITKKTENLESKIKNINDQESIKTENNLLDNNIKHLIVNEELSKENQSSKDKKQQSIKDNTKKSLMDSLVSDIKSKKVVISKEEKTSNTEDIKDKLSAKSFLSNQQTKATIVSKHSLEESKKILLDESIKDAKTKITKSAKTLELGETKVEVISGEDKTKVETKTVSKIDAKVQEQTTFLNKVLFKQALNTQDIQKIEQIKVIKQASEVEQTTSEIKSEDIQVKEVANQTAIQHITNKIISARQNMNSFMSDMARKMYENYKPPVTSFKINLNPANLGSISIVMKSEKSTNSISISLNTTNSSTLEVLEGAKGLLQNSLQKTFENQSNFSLDFSQNNDQSNTQDNSENKKRKEESNNKKEESQDIVENDISIDDGYM